VTVPSSSGPLDVFVIVLLWLPRTARRFFGGEAA
jgi:hypothetical protein